MKTCVRCKIEVRNLSENCPVCGKHLTQDDESQSLSYINIEEQEKKERISIARLLLFIQILFSLIIFITNLLTYTDFWWSVIPISMVWLLWIIVANPILKKKITPSMVLGDTLIISFFLIGVDYFTTRSGWSMDYVIPFLLFAVSFGVTVIVLIKKMTRRKFYMFQLTIAILCILPVFVRFFIDFLLWPSLISAVYGVITILGMLIFGDKTLKHETKKRLHF